MKLLLAIVIPIATLLSREALAINVQVFEHRFEAKDHEHAFRVPPMPRDARGRAYKFATHNNCVEMPEAMKPFISSLYIDGDSHIIRLWQGSKCTGENRAYGNRGLQLYGYVGDVMNDKAASVSSCDGQKNTSCDLELGTFTSATAIGVISGLLTFGITTFFTAAAMPAVFANFYNGDCRFCLGYAAQCEHRTRNYKRDTIPGLNTDASPIFDFKNVDPTIPRDRTAEKATLPLYFAKLAEHGHIDEIGLAKIFNSFLQPERLADCEVAKARAAYIQSMIHMLDTSKDGKIDVAEFAELGEAMGAE